MTRRPMTEKEIDAELIKRPILAWSYPRILLFIPKSRSLSHMDKVFDPMLHLAAQGSARINAASSRVDVARNRAALKLLQSFRFTHVLMLDNDHIYPPDTIERLARWVMADPEKLVVGALNVKRTPPYEPCAWLKDEDGTFVSPYKFAKEGLYEVEAIGTGAILINRKVFERMEPPYFYNLYDMNMVWSDTWQGEDMGFSAKCRENGIKLYMDTTLSCPHVIEGSVTIDDYRRNVQDDKDYRQVNIPVMGAVEKDPGSNE